MMEHVREEQLALYASGDLAPREDSALGAHLRSCRQCQRVLADFRNTRSFIESSLRDPEPEDLTQLRDRIATRLQQRSRWRTSDIRLRWFPAGAAAMIALVIIGLSLTHRITVLQRPSQDVARATPVEKTKAAPSIDAAPVRGVAANHRHSYRRRDGIRSVAVIARANEPPVIRITTLDPNVVILWHINERTKSE
jgi:anti-sigma factor RsiW